MTYIYIAIAATAIALVIVAGVALFRGVRVAMCAVLSIFGFSVRWPGDRR